MTEIAAAVRARGMPERGMPDRGMPAGNTSAGNMPCGTGAERLPPPCRASNDDG